MNAVTWEDVQQKVCRKCIDGDGRGDCRLPVDEECALKANAPLIFESIRAVDSPDYNAYVQALRTAVCSACVHQDRNGDCWKRNRLDCALDRYYPLIVEVVEHQQSLTPRPV